MITSNVVECEHGNTWLTIHAVSGRCTIMFPTSTSSIGVAHIPAWIGRRQRSLTILSDEDRDLVQRISTGESLVRKAIIP